MRRTNQVALFLNLGKKVNLSFSKNIKDVRGALVPYSCANALSFNMQSVVFTQKLVPKTGYAQPHKTKSKRNSKFRVEIRIP